MVPNAPLKRFTLPIFGENGYKTWEIRGDEGHYLGSGRLEVIILTIRIFSGNEHMILESFITSPNAIIDTDKKTASGASILIVRGPHYRLTGKGWTWEADKKRITVHQNARVEFDQPLGRILK